MKPLIISAFAFCAFFAPAGTGLADTTDRSAQQDNIPKLQVNGATTELLVDGKPYLILGGEVRNSSSSSLEYMQPIWSRLKAMNLNTVLTPISWELVEPVEDHFDFSLVDGLIKEARVQRMHLVFLWLASWKNGMSSYPPVWVKRDVHRFPCAQIKQGEVREVLSTFSPENSKADAKAFGELMKHIRAIDQQQQTVVMIQVENEVGILGDSRDRSPLAETAFAGEVPPDLMASLHAHEQDLVPEFKVRWEAAGRKQSGTWTEVFGAGPATDEIFMAWSYAHYIDLVAAAGKAAYPLPLYTNAWLNDKDAVPGDYPSGGPLAHVFNIWKAGAPHLDFLAPDVYVANFEERCRLFTRAHNVLFIPEMNSGEDGARNVFAAIGAHGSLGVSPFAIDSIRDSGATGPAIGKSYAILEQVAPLILAHRPKGEVTGFILDKGHPSVVSQLGGYELEISLDEIFGHHAETGAGVIIATGPDEFIGAGSGFRVAFKPKTAGPAHAAIGTIDEGIYRDGHWVPGRRLNGDESDQGSGWRMSPFELSISRCVVYRHD